MAIVKDFRVGFYPNNVQNIIDTQYWRQGTTLRTKATACWTTDMWAKNDEIEQKMVFASFHSHDGGKSRIKLCICSTKEEAAAIVEEHNENILKGRSLLENKKKVYYKLSDGQEVNGVVMDLSAVIQWISNDEGEHSENSDDRVYTITPIYLTDKEIESLPEADI